jgi:hypothetical protein
MTGIRRFRVPDNEVPVVVPTAAGPAVVCVVSVALGIEAGGRTDRLVLRAVMRGRADVYAVFERRRNDRWWKVTDNLNRTELDNWMERRRPAAVPDLLFQRWLDQAAEGVAGRPRPW